MDCYRKLLAEIEEVRNNYLLQPNNLDLERLESLNRQKATYDVWKKEAERQIFIREYKQELIKTRPNEVSKVAITVCPEVSDKHDVLYEILKIIDTIKPIVDYIAVMEQRSEKEEPEKGWHLHLSADSTYAPSKVRQFIVQKLKSRNIESFVLVKKQYNSLWLENYMKGDKHNVLKNLKVEKDRILRLKYNIPDVIKKISLSSIENASSSS